MNKWYEIKNAAAEVAEVFIYGEIGWDYTAKSFIDEFKTIKSNSVNLRINSPGGSVIDGMAIYSYLIQSQKIIDVYIDGLAASISSVIALAGDKVYMPENALFMVHNPTTFAGGSSKSLRKAADVLDKIRDQIAAVYVNKTGKSMDEIKDIMESETWYTGPEAQKAGFVDETTEEMKAAAIFDLNKYGFKNHGKYNQLNNFNNFKKGEIMTLQDLKNKYPEIFSEAKAEIEGDIAAKIAAEVTGALENERNRATQIRQAAAKSQAALCDKLIKDNVSYESAIAQLLQDLKNTVDNAADPAADPEAPAADPAAPAADPAAPAADPAAPAADPAAPAADPAAPAAANRSILDLLDGSAPPAVEPGTVEGSVLVRFNAIKDSAEKRKFYKEHEQEIKCALYRKK